MDIETDLTPSYINTPPASNHMEGGCTPHSQQQGARAPGKPAPVCQARSPYQDIQGLTSCHEAPKTGRHKSGRTIIVVALQKEATGQGSCVNPL